MSGLVAAAEDRAVAVGVNLDASGVIRRELEERIALAADGEDDAVALELLDGALDLARGVASGSARRSCDLADGEQPIAALAQQFDDRSALRLAMVS